MLQLAVHAAEETTHALIWPNWVFPLIAACVFILLAFVMHSFRDVSNRHTNGPDGLGNGGVNSGAGHGADQHH